MLFYEQKDCDWGLDQRIEPINFQKEVVCNFKEI